MEVFLLTTYISNKCSSRRIGMERLSFKSVENAVSGQEVIPISKGDNFLSNLWNVVSRKSIL